MCVTEGIMQAKLVCYELKAKPAQRTTLHKKLYGYRDFSNHGKYKYQRKGLLKKINGKRITDGVLLVTEEHVKKLLTLLKKFGAKTYIFTIVAKTRA
jgi:hypothetical protein